MVALEDAFQTRIDEGAFSQARDLSELRAVVDQAASGDPSPLSEPVDFPSWNRSWAARAIRRLSLPTWILPSPACSRTFTSRDASSCARSTRRSFSPRIIKATWTRRC